MNYADALSNLNIDLGDSDNFTFTTEEKQRALTRRGMTHTMCQLLGMNH